MSKILDFFTLRHNFATSTWHWMGWSVTDAQIADGAPLGPMQSAWEAFGPGQVAMERMAFDLLTSGRFRMHSMCFERYVWNEKEQRYEYAGRGTWETRAWLDGEEITL